MAPLIEHHYTPEATQHLQRWIPRQQPRTREGVEQDKCWTADSGPDVHNVGAATIGELDHAALRKAADGSDIRQLERRQRQSQWPDKRVYHRVRTGKARCGRRWGTATMFIDIDARHAAAHDAWSPRNRAQGEPPKVSTHLLCPALCESSVASTQHVGGVCTPQSVSHQRRIRGQEHSVHGAMFRASAAAHESTRLLDSCMSTTRYVEPPPCDQLLPVRTAG